MNEVMIEQNKEPRIAREKNKQRIFYAWRYEASWPGRSGKKSGVTLEELSRPLEALTMLSGQKTARWNMDCRRFCQMQISRLLCCTELKIYWYP